jgi:hypothetical protein
MKNLFLSIIITALSAMPLASVAQTDYSDASERIVFGVKAGFNYSNVWDERGDEFRADGKLGGVGGIFLGIPVGQYLGVQAEVLLAQKGFKGSGVLFGQPYTMTKTKTSLDIPLQVAIKPMQYFTLLAGPQYSYLLREKVEYKFGENSTAQQEEFNNDNIRKNMLGFVFGADVNIQHIVLSGRAGFDFQSNSGDGSNVTPRYKNRWLQFTIGFRI